MLTKEQKSWIVNGFCTTFELCSYGCPIRHLCKMVDVNLADIPDDVLDECLKIIAPNLLDELKC